MEPQTSSQSVSASHEVERDVNNLIDNLAGLGCNEKGHFKDVPIVIYDLDTSNRDIKTSEILQIAAWCRGNRLDKCIMLPEKAIYWKSGSRQNGFKIDKGKLQHYGNVVNALPPKQGLELFLEWLRDHTGQTRGVLLAAHGCSTDHCYVLVRLMRKHNLLATFQSLVLGFIDTIPVFKTILAQRAQEGESFNLKRLTTDIVGTKFPKQPHAVDNVTILLSIINAIECTDAKLVLDAVDLDEFIRVFDLKIAFEDVLKPHRLQKILDAPISFEELKTRFGDNQAAGVSRLLQDHWITNRSIQIINARLAELLQGNTN